MCYHWVSHLSCLWVGVRVSISSLFPPPPVFWCMAILSVELRRWILGLPMQQVTLFLMDSQSLPFLLSSLAVLSLPLILVKTTLHCLVGIFLTAINCNCFSLLFSDCAGHLSRSSCWSRYFLSCVWWECDERRCGTCSFQVSFPCPCFTHFLQHSPSLTSPIFSLFSDPLMCTLSLVWDSLFPLCSYPLVASVVYFLVLFSLAVQWGC